MLILPTERQFEVVYPHIESPDVLILAGLGEGNEAQLAAMRWPEVVIYGFDPDKRALVYQRERGWRMEKDFLLDFALCDRVGHAQMRLAELGNCTLHPQLVDLEATQIVRTVRTSTVDFLFMDTPILNGILWIDAEGYDPKVVEGAREKLTRGVKLVVMEVWTSRPDTRFATGEARCLLHDCGFKLVEVFGAAESWWGHNEVWKLC